MDFKYRFRGHLGMCRLMLTAAVLLIWMNQIHPTIKFTSEHSDTELTFLDVTVYKGDRFFQTGHLDVKTHVKPTNKQLYIHASLYHPPGTSKGIIIGEVKHYLRTNSTPTL